MISLSGLLPLLVQLICIGLVMWLCIWLVDYVGLPEPFHKVAKVIIAVVAVLVLIGFIMAVAGTPMVRW